MPCNTIQTSEVMLRVENLDVLVDALTDMGFAAAIVGEKVRFSNWESDGVYADGTFTITGAKIKETAIIQAYALAAIKKSVMPGWTLVDLGDGQYVSKKGQDAINFAILPNGTIKTTTDKISGPNHQSAEAFLQTLATKAGGNTQRAMKPGVHTHTHTHGHTHTH